MGIWVSQQRIEVPLGADPVFMEVRHRVAEAFIIDPTLRVREITFGDEAFERRYVVEGTPGDHVRALLDAPTRRAFLEIDLPRVSIREGVLTLVPPWHYWGLEPSEVEAVRRLGAELARHSAELHAEAEAQLALAAATGPLYRPEPNKQAIVAAHRHAAIEARAMRLRLRDRRLEPLAFAVGLSAGLPIAIVLIKLLFFVLRAGS
jgi:hypothetical protein